MNKVFNFPFAQLSVGVTQQILAVFGVALTNQTNQISLKVTCEKSYLIFFTQLHLCVASTFGLCWKLHQNAVKPRGN